MDLGLLCQVHGMEVRCAGALVGVGLCCDHVAAAKSPATVSTMSLMSDIMSKGNTSYMHTVHMNTWFTCTRASFQKRIRTMQHLTLYC